MNLKTDVSRETIKPTAGKLTMKLASWFGVYDSLVLPRVFTPLGEADLFVIRKSAWAEEVEIKIAENDFKREFIDKAPKHEQLQNGICRYSGPPLGKTMVREPHVISLFSFAFPLVLAEKLAASCPPYAGVYGVDLDARFIRVEVLRKPTRLEWSRKTTPEERAKLMRGVYAKYWHAVYSERVHV